MQLLFKAAVIALILMFAIQLRTLLRRKHYRRRRKVILPPGPSACGFPRKKPDWVIREVLRLYEILGLSHRKLADAFNQLHFAGTGMSVGRTWVRELLMKHAYEALHRQRALKHCIPEPEPINHTWGIDTTLVPDEKGMRHIVLGIIDHGARFSPLLRPLRRFNVYSLLGTLLLAFGEYGVPCKIRLDNHPVHRAKWIRRVLHWIGVRLHFTQLASPWQNGYIERLFGTLKSCLRGYVIRHAGHLAQSLVEFRFWYNEARCHQHLHGATPMQAWQDIDPYRRAPKQAQRFTGWNGRLRGMELRH